MKMLGKNVLVELIAPETKTSSGLELPATALKNDNTRGIVRNVSNTARVSCNFLLQEGDEVVLNKFGGKAYSADGKNYRIIHAPDILAVLTSN